MVAIVRLVAQEFKVKFDGEALATHTMDVRTLAPALLALGDAFQIAHDVLGDEYRSPYDPPSDVPPTLQIRATREGSFDIDLVVGMLSQSDAVTAAANGTGIAAVAGGALLGTIKGGIKLVKWLKGRRPPVPTFDAGMLIYRDPEGHTITVPAGSEVLIENGAFRASIDRFTEPLDAEGIEEISFSDDQEGERSLVVSQADRAALRFQRSDRLLDRSSRDATVKVETVQLNPNRGRKWRFSEGGETFTAGVEDQRFQLGVRSGRIAVGADDILRVRLQETTLRRAGGGVRIERTVLEVLDHERAPVQDEFDYDWDD